MNLELVSFKICPFVQRAVITLLHKQIPYKITYIDLASPPEWFKQLSPFGKVPILKVDDHDVIFESAIIDEFLDEAYKGKLLPDDPLQRAIDRSWIEFGTNLTLDFSGLIHAEDEKGFKEKLELTQKQFDWLENTLGQGPYFNADNLSLVDIAYAPLFMRVNLLHLADKLYPASHYPKVAGWAQTILAMPELPGSVASDFDDFFKHHIKKKAPYAASQLDL